MTYIAVGSTFGRLTTIEPVVRRGLRYMVLCACDCGTTKMIDKYNLLKGKSLSCGCLCRERTSEANTTHGMSPLSPNRHRVYHIWASMKQRCLNPSTRAAHNYIDRGIAMCTRWHSFECFLEDMGFPPSEELTLERIDNDQGYYPENCKWATRKEQGNNRRGNILIEYQGKKQTLAQWSAELEIPYGRLLWRHSSGWSIERMLTR